MLPASVLAEPATDRDDALRFLLRVAARALGIATEREMRNYFQLPADRAKGAARGTRRVGRAGGVADRRRGPRIYAAKDAPAPEGIEAGALLSPFDSLIWDRDRTLRLFGFHYRIAIYTRAADRVHGYWVMPFLLGESLVARVDLKADRSTSTLTVPAAHAEPGQAPQDLAGPLAAELRLMAAWLGLHRVAVGPGGDLSPVLTEVAGQ